MLSPSATSLSIFWSADEYASPTLSKQDPPAAADDALLFRLPTRGSLRTPKGASGMQQFSERNNQGAAPPWDPLDANLLNAFVTQLFEASSAHRGLVNAPDGALLIKSNLL